MRHRLVVAIAALLLLAACGGGSSMPGVTPTPSAPPFASSTSGQLRLDLRLDKRSWNVGEPMTGTATLTNTGAMVTTASSSMELGFRYAAAGGNRMIDPVWPADCMVGPLDPAKPITSGLTRSGAYSPDKPEDAWRKAFFEADGVQLPPGAWDVTALTSVNIGDCGPLPTDLKTTLRIVVGG
jgi:hypothetical protein